MKSVKGGTGWAVQMGIDFQKKVYVFDNNQTHKWYIFNYDDNTFVEIKTVPIITKSFAGIGTRKITSAGIQAIEDILTISINTKTKLKLWTAQYRYSGKDRFDITVKSNVNPAFTPTWDMVKSIKSNAMTEKEYSAKYAAMMEKSLNKNERAWYSLLDKEEVTLVCFCPSDSFCHRYLLANILEQLGAHYMGERTLV